MSICVAAFADGGRAIVVASDRKVSLVSGAFSADEVFTKMTALYRAQWCTLFAGDDVSPVTPIIRRVYASLKNGSPPDVDVVANTLAASFQEERSKRAVVEHLGIYQLDMAQFLSNGETLFGETGFSVLRERIERTELQCDFLCFGFSGRGAPHLFRVCNPGHVEHLDRLGCWAIGSGAYSAVSRLAIRQQQKRLSIAKTVYNVCEAKMAGEGAEGVGKETLVMILRADGSYSFLERQVLDSLRKPIGKALRPPVRQALLEQIAKEVDDNWEQYVPPADTPTPKGSVRAE